LPPLALRKVEDENSSDNQFKTDRTLTTDRNKSRLNFGTVKKTALVGSLCLILGFMLAISLAPNNSFLAGLNPFVSNPERKYLSNPNKPLIQNQEEEEDINKITLNQNGTGTLDLNGNEKIVFVYVNTTTNDNNQALKNEILSRNNPYNPPIESKKFEVVIGCFRDKGNAERMKRNAASFNLPSRVIGKNEKDLFVVSAGGFSDINSTIPCLEKAKSQFPDAWVLKK
ncbi:MAG: SPOR domain-containing protein, partial [Bacteroidota bacterium]